MYDLKKNYMPIFMQIKLVYNLELILKFNQVLYLFKKEYWWNQVVPTG